MALNKKEVAPIEHLTEDWQISGRINDNLCTLVRRRNGQTQFTFCYSIHIPFNTLRNHTKIDLFLKNNPTPENLTHTADKLKWHRYSKGIHQKDVAEYAGIDRSTYIRYESGELDFYPIEKLKLIAQLYNIDVTELLDEYNRFLYKGQGQQIRALRKSMGLTRNQFGSLFNLSSSNIKNWETDRCRIFKTTWKKLKKITPP